MLLYAFTCSMVLSCYGVQSCNGFDFFMVFYSWCYVMVVGSTMKLLSGKGTTDKIRKPPSLKLALYLVTKFVTDASGDIWWPKKKLKHVLVIKFSTNKDASPCQKR